MANAHVRTNGTVKQAVQQFFAAERRNAEFIEKHRLGLSPDDDLPPYRHQAFPRMLYSVDGEVITVDNEREEKQRLKDGWYSSPAEVVRGSDTAA